MINGDAEYWSIADVRNRGELNVSDATVADNVRGNLALNLREIVPHEVQPDTVLYLLAGGPSIKDFEDKIVEFGRSGGPVVTVNGSYNWLLDRKILPAAQIIVDGREFNSRFVSPYVSTCKYLISSQCHPSVASSLPYESVWLWHSAGDSISDIIKEHNAGHEWYPVSGGSTVITRAIVLLAMLGFRKVEVFGWDSCFIGDSHHAYEQSENNKDHSFPMVVGDRTFMVAPWMALQLDDALRVIKYVLSKIDDFEMAVHGDGLISYLLENSALLPLEK